ncbi:FAD:protein FMN transferase [Chlorobium sp.]|uniref:FAD:protein FMN transferase n=1 Tax=Chlorobium sp. TaxID=1095 RepID=UPI0025C6F439|nr:FAD:protein FMN transferase [Chlorobium sp.]
MATKNPVRMFTFSRRIPVLFTLFLTLFGCGSSDSEHRIYEQEKVLMGTVMKIKAEGPAHDEQQTRSAFDAAFRLIASLESDLSEWQEASPVSQANRAAGLEKIAVPEPVITVTRKSLDIGRITDGAFDVTFRPLGRLWNIKNRKTPPPADSIAIAGRLVDYRQIELDTLEKTIFLKKTGMEIGFGGIAKGYAAWRAGELLKSRGINNFIINAGGDLYVHGKKNRQYWTSGITDPDNKTSKKPVIAFQILKPCGIATSGEYENFFLWQGKRYHHIIDPETGYPAEGMKSVTVFSEDPAKADAYATAFFILGYEKSLEIIGQDPSAAFIMIDMNGRMLRSPNLDRYILVLKNQDNF